MGKKSIISSALSDKKIKDIMKDCYYDIEKDDEEVSCFVSTNVISINLLLSGKPGGGVPIGKISTIAAPSRLGKSFIAMSSIKNAQNKGMDVIVIDTEKSFSKNMAESLGVDINAKKLLIYRNNSIERVKTFILRLFDGKSKEERKNTYIIMDSWGVLVSSKSIKDGIDGKDVKDMTLTQKKNDLSNIILNTDATWLVINHVYDNIGGFGEILSIPGGRKLMFNSDCVLLGMNRAKEKEKDDDKKDYVSGHIISAKTYKSRYSKEESKLKFRILHNGGLDPFYGILNDAVKGGYVISHDGKPAKYSRKCIKDDKPLKEKKIYNAKFWKPIFKETDFKDYLQKKYQFNGISDILKQQEDLNDMLS